MKLHEVKPGMKIEIPIRKKTLGGLIVAQVKPGTFKSSTFISFKGGEWWDLPRDTEVILTDEPDPSNYVTFQTVKVAEEEIDLKFEQRYINAVKTKCDNCQYPLPPMFMIDEELWLSVCTKHEFLCLTCFTEKLGRKLTIYDLKSDVPLNNDLLQVLANFQL